MSNGMAIQSFRVPSIPNKENLALKQAIALMNDGQHAQARKLMLAAIRGSEADNAAAWALLAAIAKTPFQKTYYLNKVLKLRPGFPWAERKLRELTESSANGRRANESRLSLETYSPLHPNSRSETIPLPEQNTPRSADPQGSLSRATHNIITGALSLILIASIVLLVAPRLLGSDLFVILSQSMEPTVPMGAVVVSRPLPSSEIVEGDVITFRSMQRLGRAELITHRVIEVHDLDPDVRFRTQGDAVDTADRDLVLGSEVVGKVWFAVPLAGFLLAFIRTPLGFALVVGLPASFVIAGEVVTIVEVLRDGGVRPLSNEVRRLGKIRA